MFQGRVTIGILVIAVLLAVALFLVWPNRAALFSGLMYNFNLRMHSKSLPYPTEHFVGRAEEMEDIVQLIDFDKSDVRTVSIVGPPGIGKSTIAIHVGHIMVEQGITIYYVDLVEASSMQALAEKVLESAETVVSSKNVSVKRLIKWAGDLNQHTLLILDNCDNVLHEQKDNLQKVVKKLLKSSHYIKVLMTSRQWTMQLGKFQMYELHELTPAASCTLLETVAEEVKKNHTLCELIANLTGSVPLALQVVGALLSQPNSPEPIAIVRKLEEHLIPTLSPEELPPEERVNVSIYLSYQYLGHKLQKIGRYLANFPGSFDQDSANKVLQSLARNNISSDYVIRSVHQLVQRSLLEFNRRKVRFQFHTLIRQFFLDAQKSAGVNETLKFSAHFQLHYSQKLRDLNKLFTINHVRALAELDVERHNIQLLLSEAAAYRVQFDHEQYLSVVRAIENAIDSRYLNCRFTAQELRKHLRSIVNHLFLTLRTFSEANISLKPYVASYVSLLISSDIDLENLEEQLQIPQTQAIKLFLGHMKVLERSDIQTMASKPAASEYSLFYLTLSNYYTENMDPKRAKECHAKILKVTEGMTDCNPTTCSYREIGNGYYFAGSYKEGAHFLEIALREERRPIVRISLLNKLRKANLNLKYIEKAEENLAEMIALFPQLINTPASTIFGYTFLLQNIIKVYSQNGRVEEAVALVERLLEAIREIGAKTSVAEEVKEVTEYFFKQGNYAKAANLAQFGRESMKHLSHSQQQEATGLRLRLEILMGKSMFHAGNYSEGLDYIEAVMDEIYKLGHSSYPEQYQSVCMYGMFRLRFGCVIDRLLYIGKVAVYILWVSPLDLTISLKDNNVSPPLSPLQVVNLSPTTALTVGGDKLTMYEVWLTLYHFTEPLLHSWVESLRLWFRSFVRSWFLFLSPPVKWVSQFKAVRFVVRILFFYIKVRLIAYVYKRIILVLLDIYINLYVLYYLARIRLQIAISNLVYNL